MRKIQPQRALVVVGETRTVKVTPGSEVDRLLDETEDAPLLLEWNGVRFRLSKEPDDDIWAGYDPEKSRAVLEETAGSWADLGTEAIIEQIYRWREEGSRPPDQP